MPAQQDSIQSNFRKHLVTSTSALIIGTSYIALNELWYKSYPRAQMHMFNDNGEWKQMDKAGHIFSAYTLAHAISNSYRWAGVNNSKSAILGSSISFLYMTSIELLDGRSKEWGFSMGDMTANTAGTLVYLLQEKIWNEQRIVFKFSYTPSMYADMNPDALGYNFQQRMMKDYNGQTYWASFNVDSFLASDKGFPRWLNIAIGYGATEMISANPNNSNVNNFHPTREFYLSFDADLRRIRWNKKWMSTTAKILSFIKIPSPAFEINENGKMKMHGLFF